MAYAQCGAVALCNVGAYHGADKPNALGIQCRVGLIQQQHIRLRQQCTAQRHACGLTNGKAGDIPIQLQRLKAHAVQQGTHGGLVRFGHLRPYGQREGSQQIGPNGTFKEGGLLGSMATCMRQACGVNPDAGVPSSAKAPVA